MEDITVIKNEKSPVASKQPRITSRPSQFLWVNKNRNSGTLTRSDTQENTAIRKHVHVQRRKAKAEEASAIAASSLTRTLHDSGRTTSSLQRSNTRSGSEDRGQASTPSTASANTDDRDQIPFDETPRIDVHITSDGNCILTNPFGLYPARHVVSAQSAMRWFFHFFKLMPSLIIEDGFVAMLHSPVLLPLAFRDMDLFEALCLWCLTFRLHAGSDEVSRNAILWHKHRTLTGLQKRVSSGSAISDETIMITLFLANIAGREGQKEEAQAHYRGLRRMISARGGLQGNGFSLGGQQILRTTAEVGDIVFMGKSTESIHRSFLHYPKQPFSPRLCSIISTLPPQSAKLALDGKLSMEVIDILASIQRWMPDASISNIDVDLAQDIGTPSDQPEVEQQQPSTILHIEGLRLFTLFTSCLRFAYMQSHGFLFQKPLPRSYEIVRERGKAATTDQPLAHFQFPTWMDVMEMNDDGKNLTFQMVTQIMAEMIGLKVWHEQSSPRKKAVQQSYCKEELILVWDAVWGSP